MPPNRTHAGTRDGVSREAKKETLDLCTKIRSQALCAQAPLLVALDRWQANQVQYILELGNTRAVVKPLEEKHLAKAVSELLNEASGDSE